MFLSDNNKMYKDVLEAIEANNEYSLYISAPPGIKTGEENYYGGVYITTIGSLESFYKVTDPENPNFLILAQVGNGTSQFTQGSSIGPYAAQTIPAKSIHKTYVKLNAISKLYISYTDSFNDIVTIPAKISGTNIVTDDSNAYVIGTVVDNGATYDFMITGNAALSTLDLTATGPLDTYFSKPANYATIQITFELDIQEFVVQTIYQFSPTEYPLTFTLKAIDLNQTTIDGDHNPYYNTITFAFTESGYQSKDYIMSTDENAVDGYGASLYAPNVLDETAYMYIRTKEYKDYKDITGTYMLPNTITIKGKRIIADETLSSTNITNSLLEGYEAFNKSDYEDVYIVFDNTGDTSIANKMASLREGVLKTTTFVFPVITTETSLTSAVTEAITIRGSLPKIRGLAYYFNQFEIKLGKDYIYSPIMGSMALMLARIIDKKLGGRAPMFTNDNDGLGGQLNRTVRKAKYNLESDATAQDTLYNAGINGIVKDKFYGIMAINHRTSLSPSVLTDWSFLGHSMAFDLLKREIKQQILLPQLGKPIDDFYLNLRQGQAEAIVNTRLQGATAIWNGAIVLINDPLVNNDTTKKQNTFRVKIRIKVNPFSQYAELVLENVDQTTIL
jgi:hypothetical protein